MAAGKLEEAAADASLLYRFWRHESWMIGQGVTVGMADATVALIEAKAAGLDELAKGPTPALTPTTFTSWCQTVLRLAVEG